MKGDPFYSQYVKIRRDAFALVHEVNQKFDREVLIPSQALKMLLGLIFTQLNGLSSPEVFVLYNRSTGDYILDELKGRLRRGTIPRDKLDRAYVSRLLGRTLRPKEAVVLEFVSKKSM